MARRLVLAVSIAFAITATPLLAQNPQVCHGLNYDASGGTSNTIPAGTELGILYTAPPNTGLDVTNPQLSFANSVSGGGVITIAAARGTIRLETVDPATGLPSGSVIASGQFTGNAGSVISVAAGWAGPNYPNPVSIAAGTSIWVIYTRAPFTGDANVRSSTNPTDVVTSSINPGGGWGNPIVTTPYRLRFRSTNCNPAGANYPTWTSVGAGCPGSLGIPTLTPNGLPTIGSQPTLNVVSGPPGQVGALFWSIGPNLGGGIPLGNGCSLWLDFASFNQLLLAGLNPIQQIILDANGVGTFSLIVPEDVNLISVPFAFQAGFPDFLAPGGFVVSEAEVATVGW
ncbi:MAG: hypothetical protein CL908_19610 [Deltaproteobacteria bacterium]|nr:hypothetical protein [Deltaproteobacteria bacterium]